MVDGRSMHGAFRCSVRCAANAKRGTEMCRLGGRSTLAQKQLACPHIVATAARAREAGACRNTWFRAVGPVHP
jgi:hypothetical protein